MKKVIVASQNPVKIAASQGGFEQVFTHETFEFEGVSVPSEVSDQPMTTQETYQGAYNRALNAQKKTPHADFWIGIEGGIDVLQDTLEVFAWVVVLSSDQQGVAKTASFMLPPKVSKLVKEGYELGEADDIVFQKKDSKKQGGSVGILTNGLVNRTDYYVQAVVLALIPFIQDELYKETLYTKNLVG
jgi:inosine/xanthosine triphosphatase